MSNAEIRGRFVWHELMTTDPQAAGAFYSKVLPWKTQPSGMPDYTLWMSGKTQVAGLMSQPESARAAATPPSWLIYIGTPDVDSTAAAAQRLGGSVLKAPADIPGIGRFAVLSDPQGATFAIFTPGAPAPAEGAPATDFSWHELATSDLQGAVAFYSELFGWNRGDAHDMGAMGPYQLIEHGGAQIGGAYKLMDTSKAPHWLTYIQVASADRAAAAAKAAGGQVTQGPMDVPGGGRIAQIIDPQGGAFAVHTPARQAAASTAQSPGQSGSAKVSGSRAGSTAKAGAAAAQPATGEAPKAARKAASKRPSKRKAPAKRAAAKAKKRPAASRRAGKKSPPRKAAAKRSSAGRRPAGRRSAGRRSAGRRPAAKKSSARRPAARKAAKRPARKK